MSIPSWSYTLTITGTPNGRGAPPVPDPGIDALIAAVTQGCTENGIPPANDNQAILTVTQD